MGDGPTIGPFTQPKLYFEKSWILGTAISTTGKTHKILSKFAQSNFGVSTGIAHVRLDAALHETAWKQGESHDNKTEPFTDVMRVGICTVKISEISYGVFL